MKVTQTMYIRANERYNGKIDFDLVAADMSDYGWLMVGTHDVTFEAPDNFDIRQIKAKAIEKEMATVKAAFQARITELQRAYNEILAIEAE